MRLFTMRHADGRTQAARPDGDDEGTAFALPYPSVRHLLEAGPDWATKAATGGDRVTVHRDQIGLLIPNPESDPKAFLRAGQVLRTTIEGIGTLENTCVPEAA